MLAFQPHSSFIFPCPACGNSPTEVRDTLWQGIHLLAGCVCTRCRLDFYHTFPIKHARYFPLAFAKNERRIFTPPGVGDWLYAPLFDSYYENRKISVPISKTVLRQYAEVVILNCLDYVYGHALLQLLNAQAHLENTPDIGLIIIVPKNLAWLVPEGAAEIWQVDAPLAALKNRIENLDAFVKGELPRFRKVYLSQAFIHPDWNKTDIALFTKIRRFDLDDFYRKPLQVTFLWREDRCWLPTKLDDFMWKSAFKLSLLDEIKPYFLWRQKRLFVKTAKIILRQQPGVRFAVAGLCESKNIGRKTRFPAFCQDYRKTQPDTATEHEWCRLYAESHLVIGVHGSGLLLPSALAAGFIELLPRHRLANFGEGTANNHADRRQAFLSRFLDIFTKPGLVAAHAVQILGGFGFFQQVLSDGSGSVK